jgi:nucleotide-binding universal stress UspA family protein
MFKTIAVGTDGSETADKAVEMALDIAAHYRARLLIFSVYQPVGAGRLEREQEGRSIRTKTSIRRSPMSNNERARAV